MAYIYRNDVIYSGGAPAGADVIELTVAEYETDKEKYDAMDAIIVLTDSDKNGGDASNVKYKDIDVASALDYLMNHRSHIGMIIHTTTLTTMEKVIEEYGGTKWIQHSGYVLRGATSGVVANSNTKTGGNDNMIIPYHNHSVSAVSITSSGTHNHANWKYDTDAAKGTEKNRANSAGGTTASANLFAAASGGHTHTVPAHDTNYVGTSGNTTNANIPNYKSVYIWERVK